MDLKDIYARCGLKDPKDFAIEVRTNSLFMDQSYAKSILEYGRGLGKTTNFMMMGIQNLFIENNTIIWTTNFSQVRDNHHVFLRYSNFFPELKIEIENNGQFIAKFSPKNPRLKFVTLYNNLPQANLLGFCWDADYDDSH